MRRRHEAYRDVNRPLLQILGNKLDEFMLENDVLGSFGPILIEEQASVDAEQAVVLGF